jgi:protein SCO1/2
MADIGVGRRIIHIKSMHLMKNSLIILLLIAVFAVMGVYLFEASTPQASNGAADIGGAFSLTDQNGKRVTEATFKGKDTLVFFGFTSCPDICPTTLSVITQVMKGLSVQGENLTPVFISVDAGGDTPESMKVYLSNFHPAIVGLTGNEAEIKQAATAYKVYYAKVPQPNSTKGYSMDHSAFIYFMDKNGQYIAHFSHDDSADKIIATVKPYLEKSL